MDIVLVYFKANGERKDFPLTPGKTVVGRGQDCDYRIPDQQVSREHCEFELDDDGAVLRDLKSSNGTYVNDKRIAEVDLGPGDQIVIGPAVFVVQIDGAPAEPEPVRVRPAGATPSQPGDEEVAEGALTASEDDETREADLLEEDEDELELDDSNFVPDDESDEGDESDSGSLSDALEALASGADEDDDDDPFADLEDSDKK